MEIAIPLLYSGVSPEKQNLVEGSQYSNWQKKVIKCKVPAKHQATAQRQITAVLRVFRAKSSRSGRKIAH